MNLYTTLHKLCVCPSISGREDNIRGLLSELILPFADEVRVDALGNLIAKKRGCGEGESIMLCAHMDEIGFLVNFIEDSGMLRVATVGGISMTASAYSEVVSEKGVRGVLVPNADTKPADIKADKLYIDIGAKNKKEAEKKVSIGDFFTQKGTLTPLMGKRVAGRPLDDRIGCAVLLGIAEKLSSVETQGDVYYVFSVQEEVGCRGAMTAAFGISPDYALCFDVTATGDTPAATSMACKLSGGAAVKIKDNSVICSEEVVTRLCDIAKEKKIPYQREILTFGGTDTSAMQLSGSGCLAGALSIPTRYIHSGVETCDLSDAEACINLAVEFIKEL